MARKKCYWEKMRRCCINYSAEFFDDTATKENSHTRLLLIICSISFFCPVAIGSKHTKFGNPPEPGYDTFFEKDGSKHTRFGNAPELRYAYSVM